MVVPPVEGRGKVVVAPVRGLVVVVALIVVVVLGAIVVGATVVVRLVAPDDPERRVVVG